MLLRSTKSDRQTKRQCIDVVREDIRVTGMVGKIGWCGRQGCIVATPNRKMPKEEKEEEAALGASNSIFEQNLYSLSFT